MNDGGHGGFLWDELRSALSYAMDVPPSGMGIAALLFHEKGIP
jgi:hypothetical protein